MAKRKTKKTKPRFSLPRLPEAWASLGAAPWLNATAWTLGGVALVAGWILGIPHMQDTVAAATAPTAMSITFTDRPAWVEGDLLAMLETTALQHMDPDPFNQRSLERTREALWTTAWFEAIPQVRRVRADRVEIEADFVHPFAVIRDGAGDHLIDRRGKLLPLTYPRAAVDETAASVRRYVIKGVHFDRPTRPGEEWAGADVTAALRLLRLIDTKPWFTQVASVDASRYLDDETLVITTHIGARITWGNAPGEEPAGEVPAKGKIAYLDAAYAQFERIDRGHSGELYFLHKGYIAR